MSVIANQKFNQLYLQGYQPLQKRPEDCYEGPPPGHRSLRISPRTAPTASRKQLRGRCFTPIPDPQPLPSSLLKKKWGNDRVLMLRFVNRGQNGSPAPYQKFPCSKPAPPLSETTKRVLTSLASLFYNSHTWPRVCAAPSFPGQPGSLGLPLNSTLGCETFLMSFLCEQHFS
jgi:hypothetical protein